MSCCLKLEAALWVLQVFWWLRCWGRTVTTSCGSIPPLPHLCVFPHSLKSPVLYPILQPGLTWDPLNKWRIRVRVSPLETFNILHALAAIKHPCGSLLLLVKLWRAWKELPSWRRCLRWAFCTAEVVGSWGCAEEPGTAAVQGGQRNRVDVPPHRWCSWDSNQGGTRNITARVWDGNRGGWNCRSQEGGTNKTELNFLYTSGVLVFKQRIPGFKFVFI